MTKTLGRTVGEVVDERGPCVLMERVVKLAEAHRRIPVGWWVLPLEDEWELTVNGTPDTRDDLPPWNCMLTRGGWPVAMFDTADGILIGGIREDDCIRVLSAAIEQAAR